jgi:hypothetical protein
MCSLHTPTSLLSVEPCQHARFLEAKPERGTDYGQFVSVPDTAFAGQIVNAGLLTLQEKRKVTDGKKFVLL